MQTTNKTKQELLDLIEDVKMQDEAFKNVKARINVNLASLKVRKIIALFESSPQHLTHFASVGDLKNMRGVVAARQTLIETLIKDSAPDLKLV